MQHKYYARTEEERAFDNGLRQKVQEEGTDVEMALYIQNQSILSMLRRMDEKLDGLTFGEEV